MDDLNVMLLSWAQTCALLMISPEQEHETVRTKIEDKLQSEFQVTEIQLVGRTLEEYAISYKKNGEMQIIRLPVDEVESIYDL